MLERYPKEPIALKPSEQIELAKITCDVDEYIVLLGIGTRWQPGLKYYLEMDGSVYEINWQIASIDKPYQFKYPWIIEHSLRIIAKNEGNDVVYPEVVIDYIIVKRSSFEVVPIESY